MGPLLAKIREIAGNAAIELQKRVRIMLAKIQVDLMLHDPVLAAERARLRAKKQKELDEKRNAELDWQLNVGTADAILRDATQSSARFLIDAVRYFFQAIWK